MNSVKNELWKQSGGSGKQLIRRKLDNGMYYYVLSDESGTRSFLDDWLNDPRSKEKARRLIATVVKITTNGLKWATETKRVRRISPDLYEIKNFSGAARVMAHIRVTEAIVMLRPFQGHSGTGSIPTATIASAVRQQRLVVELLKEDD
ncbi:hypothetical protein [Eggerthella sinensis]|uniref:hypothetical protein n=1 Tax=Eggerthella sinensis TaxID=242230 RepID=UPI00266BDC57|nr:hypothetical protein [Eggerthella sinensis]